MIVGNNILFQTEIDKLASAVVAFGTFCLLDFDYSKQHEYGMLILQTLVFKDEKVPGEIAHVFQEMAKLYGKYKRESSRFGN